LIETLYYNVSHKKTYKMQTNNHTLFTFVDRCIYV